jgi:hypothetical protein
MSGLTLRLVITSSRRLVFRPRRGGFSRVQSHIYRYRSRRVSLYACISCRSVRYEAHSWVHAHGWHFFISTAFDTVGAMAKSVDDLATLISYVQEKAPGNSRTSLESRAGFQKDWSGLRLGFVDPDKWRLPPGFVTPVEEVETQIVSTLFCFGMGQRAPWLTIYLEILVRGGNWRDPE